MQPASVEPTRARQHTRRARQRWVVPLLLVAIIVVADQVTKRWVIATLGPAPYPYSREIGLLGDWISLTYFQNSGVAFGLFQSFPQVFTVVAILITAGAVFAYVVYLPNQYLWLQASIGLVVGGALGNIIDRIRLGLVVDFIQVGWFPIFNIADSAITVGVSMLALYLMFVGEEELVVASPHDDTLLNALLSQDVHSGREEQP